MPEHPPDQRGRTTSTDRWIVVGIAVLVVLRLGAALWLHQAHIDEHDNILGGDGRRYDEITTGQGTPYRDFEVEYPPVTLGLLELTHGPDLRSTLDRVIASQVVLDLGIVAALAWAWNRRTALAYLVLSTPLVLFPFLYVRIDLLSVFLATLGLALVRKGLERSGGVGLAVSVFAKVWPLVLAPVLLVERKIRAGVTWAASLAACGVAWVLWAGTSGPEQVLTFRGAKGWQIESIIGVWYHWADPAGSHVEEGAWRTAAAIPAFGRPLLTLLGGLTVVAAWVLAARRRRAGDDDSVVYGLAPLVCLLGLLVFAPILSPQYILWLLPSAAIVAARRDAVQGALTLVVCGLTAWVFATIHAQVRGDLYAIGPLLLRNLLLVVMLVVGFVQLARPVRPGTEPVLDVTTGDPATATKPQPESLATTTPSA